VRNSTSDLAVLREILSLMFHTFLKLLYAVSVTEEDVCSFIELSR
jgi:hypothetical protein